MDFNGQNPISHPHPHLHPQSQQQPQPQSQPQSHTHPAPIPYSTPSMTPGFCAQDGSQTSNQSYLQGQQIIPPTPNSMELHGNAARYSHRDEHSEMYDRYSRMNEEQV